MIDVADFMAERKRQLDKLFDRTCNFNELQCIVQANINNATAKVATLQHEVHSLCSKDSFIELVPSSKLSMYACIPELHNRNRNESTRALITKVFQCFSLLH